MSHVTLDRACRPPAARSLRGYPVLAACLLIVAWPAAGANAARQASPRAEANQLHAAIANGDLESVKYWLTVRHADPTAANASEPDVTPLERCLALAARVLDAPPVETAPPPSIGLRLLQDMVTLLHDHGARLTDADRQPFSGPVLRWYDDAVSSPSVSPPPKQEAAPPAPPRAGPPPDVPPDPPAPEPRPPVITLEMHPVVITTDPHEKCNGTGHVVYVVNRSPLSVVATVSMNEESAAGTAPSGKTDSYTVDPASLWRLGCDASNDGRRVRYVLKAWR